MGLSRPGLLALVLLLWILVRVGVREPFDLLPNEGKTLRVYKEMGVVEVVQHKLLGDVQDKLLGRDVAGDKEATGGFFRDPGHDLLKCWGLTGTLLTVTYRYRW